MVEAHFNPCVFDEGYADREGDDVECRDGGFLFDSGTAGNEVSPERHEDRCEEAAKKEAERGQADKDCGHSEAGQERVGEGVRHEGEAADDDECAEESVGEAHEHAGQKGAAHEVVFEGFENPVHG